MQVDGEISLTPAEIMVLQDENRELREWGKVSCALQAVPWCTFVLMQDLEKLLQDEKKVKSAP